MVKEILCPADESTEIVVKDTTPVTEIETSEIVVMTDDFTLATVNADTGEILGIEDTPAVDTEVVDLINWVGLRRMKALAKLQGIQAEKDEWLAKIEKQYDSEIKHLERFVGYLEATYSPVLYQYAKAELTGKKAKTLKIAFMELKFGTTRDKVNVVDESKAVELCEKSELWDAIKTTKTVLKSMIPDEVKDILTEDLQEQTGMFYYGGGEETFTIK